VVGVGGVHQHHPRYLLGITLAVDARVETSEGVADQDVGTFLISLLQQSVQFAGYPISV